MRHLALMDPHPDLEIKQKMHKMILWLGRLHRYSNRYDFRLPRDQIVVRLYG